MFVNVMDLAILDILDNFSIKENTSSEMSNAT